MDKELLKPEEIMKEAIGKCPLCDDKTVLFSGKGLDTQYKICPDWQRGGHLTHQEISDKIQSIMRTIRPSGRWA